VADDTAGIVTPEAVVLEFDSAGAGSRGVGELLDVLLMVVAFWVVALVILLGLGAAASEAVAWIAVVAVTILFMVVFFGYPIGAETAFNGRTLGKAAMGVRVVTVEGGPVRVRHAAIRGLIGFAEIYLTFGLVALLAIIFSKRNQRLGDMVAGTIVLRERNASKRAVAVSFPAPGGLEGYVESLDVTRITPHEYGVIRSFLMRVFELTPTARATIGVRLANPVARRMDHTPPAGIGPELFLVCVAAAIQRRHGGAVPVAAPSWPAGPGGYAVPPGGGYGPAPAYPAAVGGYAGAGYPPQAGYPGQGYPGQGYPGQGYPGQGYPGQGYPGQGYPGQG
jgi:uncharacterized RDD family membrane protein YckC